MYKCSIGCVWVEMTKPGKGGVWVERNLGIG